MVADSKFKNKAMKPSKKLLELAEAVYVKYCLFRKTFPEVMGEELQNKYLEIVKNVYINNDADRLGYELGKFLAAVTEINKEKDESETKPVSSPKIIQEKIPRKFVQEAKKRQQEFIEQNKMLNRDNDGDPMHLIIDNYTDKTNSGAWVSPNHWTRQN